MLKPSEKWNFKYFLLIQNKKLTKMDILSGKFIILKMSMKIMHFAQLAFSFITKPQKLRMELKIKTISECILYLLNLLCSIVNQCSTNTIFGEVSTQLHFVIFKTYLIFFCQLHIFLEKALYDSEMIERCKTWCVAFERDFWRIFQMFWCESLVLTSKFPEVYDKNWTLPSDM